MKNYTTLHEMLAQSAQKFQDRPAFKVKKHGRFVSINYKELYLKLRCNSPKI